MLRGHDRISRNHGPDDGGGIGMETYRTDAAFSGRMRRRETIRGAKLACIYLLAAFLICCTLYTFIFIMMRLDYCEALASEASAGMDPAYGLGQTFAAVDLQDLAKGLAIRTYGEAAVEASPSLIENVKSVILSKYTLDGVVYRYDMVPTFRGWPFLGLFIWSACMALMQAYALLRVGKAGPKEYCAITVLMFASLDMPAAVLLVCGWSDVLDTERLPSNPRT